MEADVDFTLFVNKHALRIAIVSQLSETNTYRVTINNYLAGECTFHSCFFPQFAIASDDVAIFANTTIYFCKLDAHSLRRLERADSIIAIYRFENYWILVGECSLDVIDELTLTSAMQYAHDEIFVEHSWDNSDLLLVDLQKRRLRFESPLAKGRLEAQLES